MHKNPIWLAFLALLILITLWFCGIAIYRTYHYLNLTAKAEVETIQWSVHEQGSDNYYPYAHYTFRVRGKEVKGESGLPSYEFMNPYAVHEFLPQLSSKKWQVWYNPSHVQNSALQKQFPVKACIIAGVMVGLLLYFIGLGFYVAKRL